MKNILLNYQRVAGYIFLAILVSIFSAPSASAQALDVQFEQTPLFNESDIVPGSGVSRSVIVTNNSLEQQTLYTTAQNSGSTGLAEIMILSITDTTGVAVMASSSFSNFFTNDPILLGQFLPSESKTYFYNAYFDQLGDNQYQNTTMQFDLAVGFMGGPVVIDNGGNSGGGGSGGGSGGVQLPTSSTSNFPAGQVAGDSVSLFPDSWTPSWWQPFTERIAAIVSGVSTTSRLGTDTANEETEAIQVAGASTSTDISTPVVEEQEGVDCTLLWLLLLALLSLSTSFIDDLWRHKGKVFLGFFFRQLVFSLIYISAVVGLYFMGWLDSVWYIFAALWTLMQILEYKMHARQWEIWQPRVRLITLASGGFALVTLSLTLGWPCIWWPFATVMLISIATYILL